MRLETMKAGITKGSRSSAFQNVILNGSWPIVMQEAEEATEEAETDTNSGEEMSIRQPQVASSSSPDAMASILQQRTKITVLP